MRTPLVLTGAAILSLSGMGCGGSAPSPDSPASAPTDKPLAEEPPAGDGDPKLRAEFMTGCMSTANSDPYCACAWTVTREMFSLETLRHGQLSQTESAALSRATLERCADRMPEATIRDGYVEGCSRRAAPKLCSCLWGKLRQSMSPGQIVTADPEQAEFKALATQQAQQCEAEHPDVAAEETDRRAFMQGCTKDSTGKESYCHCAWKGIRQQYSIEQIRDAEQTLPPNWEATLEKIAGACKGN